MSRSASQLRADWTIDVQPGNRAAAAEVDSWFEEFAASRDPDLRERIILAYLGLADRLARRYKHCRGTSPEDLTQTARAALVMAVDRYDPTRSPTFVSFAVATITGEIKRYLRDTSWSVHVPRPLKERAMQLCEVADNLEQRLGRSPSMSQLAEYLDVPEDDLGEALGAANTRRQVSLDEPVDDDTDTLRGDLLAAPGPQHELEDLFALRSLLGTLPTLDRSVIIWRFFEDVNQTTIAARIGYSQMHVSRLLRRAIDRMRAELLELDDPYPVSPAKRPITASSLRGHSGTGHDRADAIGPHGSSSPVRGS